MKQITMSPTAYFRALALLTGKEHAAFLQTMGIHHRGKGRGSPNRRYGNKPGKYLPHSGKAERSRRLNQIQRKT